MIEKLSRDEPEKFAAFLKAFGNTLKEGIVEDATNRERIAKLLRFASTKGDGAAQTVSLDAYVGRMAPGQDAIWYVTADGHRAAAGSPQLEAFRAKDIEVLLMSDRIDEWMLGNLHEYAGKPLKHVAKGELPLDEADKARQEEATKAAAPLLEKLKGLLGDRVEDVKRPPCGEIEEPCHIALQRRDARLRHQEERENDREHGEEDHRQHDVQNRNPCHRLLSDRIIGVARLNVGTGLREGVDLCGARPAGHRISGLHESIDCCVLAHHLSKVVARACEGRTDDGNVVFELVRRQSVAELGIDLLAPKRRVGLDHWTPLRVERLVRLPASDDEAVNRSVTLSLKPFLPSGFRSRPDRSPELGPLRKIVQGHLHKHQH